MVGLALVAIVSAAVALRKGDGAARWNCHRKKRRLREGEIPVSPFVLRTHRILACRQPSVEWRLEGEREHVFFQGFQNLFHFFEIILHGMQMTSSEISINVQGMRKINVSA